MRVTRAIQLSAAILVLLASGCKREPSPDVNPPPTVHEAPSGPTARVVECDTELPEDARCGTVDVFEDRRSGTGRRIALRYVVLPATGSEPAPDPIVLIAGGPGQAATDMFSLAHTLFAPLNRARDILLVDQRGTGASNGFRCPLEQLPEMLEGILHPDQRERLNACREGFEGDPSLYTTSLAVDDLDDVRAALGYEQVNLWGISYGTRVALEYLRRHGDSIRSATLWGVARPDLPFHPAFMPATQGALDALFEACAADPTCKAMLPEGRASLNRIAERLEAEPARVEILDPRSGEPVTVELDRRLFIEGVRLSLYDSTWAAGLPAALAAAEREDYQPLLGFVVAFELAIASQVYFGMHLAVTCSEDIPFLAKEDFAAARESILGEDFLRDYTGACEGWPRAELPADWREPVRSEVPVLLLNGAVDPATPASTALEVGELLANAEVVVFEDVAHGMSNAEPCMSEIAQRFLDDPRPDALDTSCAGATERPPFLVR